MKALKTLLKVLAWLLVLTGLALLGVFLGQRILMYPGAGISGTPTDWNARIGAVQNRGFAAVYAAGGTEGAKARGLWAQARENNVPAVLWFHSRGEDITETLGILGPLQGQGIHVLAMEYPGYGDAEGETSEGNILVHAEAAFDYLWNQDGVVAPRRVFVGGKDLGAAVALRLAARKDVAGVIAFSTLPDMADAVSARLKGFPVGFLLRDRFQVEPILPTISAAVLFVHGTADDLVPAARVEGMAALLPKAKVMTIEGAGHDDLAPTLTRDQWDEIGRFVFEGMK